MTRYSFADIRAVFVTNTVIESFGCIANPYNRNDCQNELWPERVEDAQRLCRRAESGMILDELRDIINCLLCVDCQRGYTHKDKVERKWSCEFPDFDFSSRRSPSPYSLKSGRRRGREASTPSRSFSASPHSPAEGHSSPRYLETPPPQPSFTSRRQEPSSVGSNAIPKPKSTALILLTPALDLRDGEHGEITGSPSVLRTARPSGSNAQPPATPDNRVIAVTSHDDGESMDTSASENHDEDVRPVVADDQAGAGDTVPDEPPVVPAAPSPFSVGEASTWAPWTIRDEVLSTLLEPLPKPNSKGSIYAVRVVDTPYLKIGYTMRKVKDRCKEISRRHDVDLETNAYAKLSGIPYLQLLRLEALVHADLAYFQRNLRMPNGTVHREYFEVDIATAQKSMKKWWRVMQDIRLEPGRELDHEVCEEIEANPALNIETSDDQVTAIPAERWPEVNVNHALREGVWKTVFKLDQGGLWESHGTGVPTKFIVFILSWLFLGVLDQHTQLGFIAVIGFAFMFMQRVFW